ncbi:MAG: ParB/RepB/Spo0J family partition protein [Firmicutes bacterium]|nr:ParB/RepB/Spo0J family partition protein [Bacillota bacterium]
MAGTKKGGLGRGLEALFADSVPVTREVKPLETASKPAKKSAEKADPAETVQYISIHDVKPNANQPRKIFDEEKIAELAASIKENGIIQPLIVRKKGKGYEIVAGERRWRASVKAELKEVPCIVRELDDEQNMLLAIVENMQREDLNPMEEAEGLNQMIAAYGLTQEQVSKSIGKSRPYIANSLRLLKLPEEIRDLISDGSLSAGHGRTLVSVPDEARQIEIARKILKEGLSVRETEKLAAEKEEPGKKRRGRKPKDPDVARVEADLKEALGTRVNIKRTGKEGKIEIEFFSRDELERLIEMLESLGDVQ